MAAVALWADQTIPADARVALHYGLDGQPDRFGPKGEAVLALWIMTGLGVFLTGLFAAMRHLDPRRENLARSAGTYLFVWIGSLVLLLGICVMMAVDFTGAAADSSTAARAALGGTGVMMVILGNALGKVRPNFTLGVRTPWTLTSDIAWDKTHRLAGWLIVIWGLAQIVSAAIAPIWVAIGVAAIGGLAMAAISIGASYVYWRAAPDKRTA